MKNIPILPILYCFFIDGEKGGVGKTTFAKLFLQWMLDNKRQVIGIDCDRSNQGLADYYSSIAPIKYAYFSEDRKQAWEADHTIEIPVKHKVHIVADFPAQTYRSQIAYFLAGGFQAAKRNKLKLVKFFLCCDWYSADQFVDSFNSLGAEIIHILVLNEGLCDDFSFLDDHKELQTILQDQHIPIIRMGEIPYREKQIIETFRLPYSQAIESEHMTIVGQQRLYDFVTNVYDQLDQLHLFVDE